MIHCPKPGISLWCSFVTHCFTSGFPYNDHKFKIQDRVYTYSYLQVDLADMLPCSKLKCFIVWKRRKITISGSLAVCDM